MPASTLIDKLWNDHVVVPESDETPAVLYVDLHLVHEVTSPQAFAVVDALRLKVRRPDLTVATLDHSTPTLSADADGSLPFVNDAARQQVDALIANCARHGITLYGLGDPRRGIVHVIGPELGLTLPGHTIVCCDSHTSTHGAFGALSFGIGTTEVGHVLATQCLFQRKPKQMRITYNGKLQRGVSAKDLALATLATIGADGGQGFAIEFAGPAVRALSMEGRMTLCNMSIEAGARCGLVAPDTHTIDWLRGRAHAPQGEAFERAAAQWLTLASDAGAVFDREVSIDASQVQPMATWGVSPDAARAIIDTAPSHDGALDALAYMGIKPGAPLQDTKVDRVFIGSCTNARIEDLRAAATVLRGRKVFPGVVLLIVPGSEAVRRQAEAEGLAAEFVAAGAQWREPGCSMCIAMNGDAGAPGDLVVSTSNRNFVGRQGRGVRTILASPATAAASAVAGRLADPRDYIEPSAAGRSM